MKKFFAFFILGSLFVGSGSVLAAEPKPVKVTVGHFSNITHAQAVIGHANGWFQESLGPNAPIDWKVFNAGPSALESSGFKASFCGVQIDRRIHVHYCFLRNRPRARYLF